MKKYLILFWLPVTVGTAQADVLPPDSKWVQHILRFENLNEFPDHVFYVYPRDLSRGKPGNSSIRVPANGEVSISGINPFALRNGLFLYAVPRTLHGADDRPPDEEWFDGKNGDVLKSTPLPHPIRTLPNSDKRERLLTMFRVQISDGLKLTEVSEPIQFAVADKCGEVEDSNRLERWALAGCALGAAIAVGGVLIARRMKRG